jgi:hypothetical protein
LNHSASPTVVVLEALGKADEDNLPLSFGIRPTDQLDGLQHLPQRGGNRHSCEDQCALNKHL